MVTLNQFIIWVRWSYVFLHVLFVSLVLFLENLKPYLIFLFLLDSSLVRTVLVLKKLHHKMIQREQVLEYHGKVEDTPSNLLFKNSKTMIS